MTQRIDCEVIRQLGHFSSPPPAHTEEKMVTAKNTCLSTLCGRFAPPGRFFSLAPTPPDTWLHPSNPRQILDNISPIGNNVKEIPAKLHNRIQPNLTIREYRCPPPLMLKD